MVDRYGQVTSVQFLRCRVHDHVYCIEMSSVRGLRRVDALVPQTGEDGMVGWIPLQEQQTPVYRFSTILQRETAVSMHLSKILLFKGHVAPWALLVDHVEGVLEKTSADVYPLPHVARNPAADFFLGVVKHENRMQLIVSPEGLQPQYAASMHRALATAVSPEAMYDLANIRASRISGLGKLFLFATSQERALTFGVSLSQVVQVSDPLPITPLPCAADYILGLVEWRGLPLAVLDLSKRMGNTPSMYGEHTRLLILRAVGGRSCIGVPIQPQVEIRTLPLEAHVSHRPVPLRRTFIRGQFALEETTLVIPDIDGVLTPEPAPHTVLSETTHDIGVTV